MFLTLRRTLTTSTWPLTAATCKAVHPKGCFWLGSAPFLQSLSTATALPFLAALNNGRSPTDLKNYN